MAVIQTSCRYCRQDIENFAPYRKGEWRDRGNNTHCPTPSGDAGQLHAPYRYRDDIAVYRLVWSPEGREIARVEATSALAAIRKAPKPYRKYLGEIYAELVR